MPKKGNFEVSWNGLDKMIDRLEEASKEESIRESAEKALKTGFHIMQDEIKDTWNHDKGIKHTKDYIIKEDKVFNHPDRVSTGVGFIFDNSIDPKSPQARGGVIAQYIMYGTHVIKQPDTELRKAVYGAVLRNKAIREAEKVLRAEIIKKIE